VAEKRTILIVDDEPFIRDLIRRMLSDDSLEVLEAPDGLIAIEMAQTQRIDVIILDVSMPEMDGREVTQRLKDDASTRQIPIIMLTSYDSDEQIVEGLNSGADDYVTKSVSAAQLIARVRAMLRVRDLQDDLVRMEPERHESRLALARDIQERLLPQAAPELGQLDLAVRYHPSEAIGGDFYDYFSVSGQLCVVLGDAEGHGISAALLMATARAYIRASLDTEDFSPAALLSRVNGLVCRDPGHSGFLPMVCVFLDPQAGIVRYANAGHEGPILFRSTDAEAVSLGVTSPILGIQDGLHYADNELPLNAGDVLACFTDGLTDAVGEDGKPFGHGRLQRLAAGRLHEPANRLADRIVAAWEAHSGTQAEDDMTLILARVTQAPS